MLNGSNGHALLTGSNAVFLREIVDKVGGFPTDTITEDFELGTKINSEGYISIATREPVSSGITPVDIKSVIKQRTRWARGVIQSCRNMHIFTNPKITLLNRIILINTWLYWWSFSRRLIYIAAPLLYALFKVQVVNANFWILMIVWAPGYFYCILFWEILPAILETNAGGESRKLSLLHICLFQLFWNQSGSKLRNLR
ncbi:glycosyltransferase [Pediococcus pentosaceus]